MLKAFRISLLIVILVGVGFIVSESLWVPKLVDWILQDQGSAPVATLPVSATPITHAPKRVAKTPILSSTLGSPVLGEQYYKDSQYVYIGQDADSLEVIPSADPSTFTLDVKTASTTKNYYLAFAQDKKHVYYNGKITNFTPQFVLLESGSRKDCGWDPIVSDIVNGQLEFFTITYDTNNIPSWVSITGADPSTFQIVGNGYSKDKNHVWVGASTTSADPATFDASQAIRCPGGF